jgi:uncharacterized lipoprotein YehR (DUF1307 family)
MKDIIRMNQLAGIITEGQAKKMMEVLGEATQDFKIISKTTRKSEYGDQIFDNYRLELLDEDYTTPDGLTFHLKTIATVLVPEGEELNPDKGQEFVYIWTLIFDENGKELEKIPGAMQYGTYNRAASINKAKKWLNQRGSQLMSGKGFQHKST